LITCPTASADLRCSGERAGVDPRFDRREGGLGRGEEILPFARPLGRDERVATDDQAFARVVGAFDLGQVLLVEERQLQRALLDQLSHLRRLEGGDPADPLRRGLPLSLSLRAITAVAAPATGVERLAYVPRPDGVLSVSPSCTSMSWYGMPSSLATIWAKVVSCPCP
jgi:hypothetical protein